MNHRQLQRMQWAVRATLALGVAASVTANILHAQPNPISQAIAAWPPMALLITVELVTRVPVHRRSLGVVRVVAASAIAAIAAWISYHHMVGVVARYGETGTVPYLLPLSVDGLIIVASVSLVELAARRRETDSKPSASATAPSEKSAPAVVEPPPSPITADAVPARPSQPSKRPSTDTPHLDGVVTTIQHPIDDHMSNDSWSRHDPAGGTHEHGDPDPDDETSEDIDLPPDLVPLLPAARTARDELAREGQTVSRDALARRLRRNGHSIRNSGVSQMLSALRRETRTVNGSRPTTPA
ncbi:DUF2637 domain-containing protein [Micromonospora sp. NBC_01813]|uniref:DUF2637 domain-containing protein n=1 Tax=Micromonospora sp. NBC_01813 TaxID=2975988 RepID=UPI002DD7A39C|nr:DUF2637 domain-containing protein [Micromonospora sp. NBC_01813]WSA06829.1 DUF2637 domain-containing protein [Micromonospora sp. NBC_01813]